ncbi:hypothetical protein ASD74_24070 [Rhizobium sp. Root564]|nr:hypothetical protein ASD74_24070 [Rhizobium sp. Root564]
MRQHPSIRTVCLGQFSTRFRKPTRLTRIDLGNWQVPREHKVFESPVIRSGRFTDNTRDRRVADPSGDGFKPVAIVAHAQPVAMWQSVQIDMLFRDIGTDGNISHLFRLPCLSSEPKARVSVQEDWKRWG